MQKQAALGDMPSIPRLPNEFALEICSAITWYPFGISVGVTIKGSQSKLES